MGSRSLHQATCNSQIGTRLLRDEIVCDWNASPEKFEFAGRKQLSDPRQGVWVADLSTKPRVIVRSERGCYATRSSATGMLPRRSLSLPDANSSLIPDRAYG